MDQQTKIVEVLRRVTSSDVNPGLEENLFESGILDSFGLADFVSALEKEFGVTVPDSDLIPRKFESISRIDSYLGGLR